MARIKKILLPLCILAAIVCTLWIYWGRQKPLMELLPQDTWTKVRIWKGDDNSKEQEWEIQPPELEAVLDAMEATRADRNDKDKYVGANYFRIQLYREGSPHPTLIYIRNAGKLRFAIDYDLDNYQDYEHAEELYEALALLTENSAIKE